MDGDRIAGRRLGQKRNCWRGGRRERYHTCCTLRKEGRTGQSAPPNTIRAAAAPHARSLSLQRRYHPGSSWCMLRTITRALAAPLRMPASATQSGSLPRLLLPRCCALHALTPSWTDSPRARTCYILRTPTGLFIAASHLPPLPCSTYRARRRIPFFPTHASLLPTSL